MSNDPIMAEIIAASAVMRGGDRAWGRKRLEAVWVSIAADPDPMHECALAHSLADAQDDPAEELAWDLRSLDAALRCTDADVQRHSQAMSIKAFMPSVYANLAEDYFKLGDLPRSLDHLATAREAVNALPNDAYGQLIRRGIERIELKINAAKAA